MYDRILFIEYVWHMYQNAAKHLSHVFSGSSSFEHDFSHCVYECEYEKDFLAAWDQMLEKYVLTDNEWLDSLFKDRKRWALVYGRQSFCVDMKSTQRSESLKNVIKKILASYTKVARFFWTL